MNLVVRSTDAAASVDAAALARTKQVMAAFFQSGSRVLHGWNPPVRRLDEDVRAAGASAMARAVDGIQNSGWLAGAIERVIGQIIGNGLQLQADPDWQALGWDKKTAQEWGTLVENDFNTWAKDAYSCSADGQTTFARMQAMQLRTWFAHGEHLATIERFDRAGANGTTRINLLDPLTLPREGIYVSQGQQGIITDQWGLPQSYIFRIKKADGYAEEQKIVPARSETGTRLVSHVFDGGPGQRRGITPLAPALRVVRQYDQLADATLTTVLLQTIFAATIKSVLPPEEVFSALRTINDGGKIDDTMMGQMLTQKTDWYKNSEIDLRDHGRITHMLPNESLEFNSAKAPHDNYDPFSKGLLREIACCLPVTYESFSGDYTGATYSSVRMANSEGWPIVLYRRDNIAAPFCQTAYEARLEERIATGAIPYPGGFDAFIEQRAAAARAKWRGPARPTADDNKTAQAQQTRIDAGLSTYQAECAENGLDWMDVLDAEQQVMEERVRRGLPPRVSKTTAPPDDGSDDKAKKKRAKDA